MRRSIEERYETDPVFRGLVEHFYHFLVQCYQDGAEFTPTEVREAVMLATMKYELKHVRPILLADGRCYELKPAKKGETA